MNRNEIVDLLEIFINCYPNAKIKDAGSMVSAWEMCLGCFSAESVYRAARLHMETSCYFPTISDIRDKIVRAEIVYKDDDLEVKKIGGSGEQSVEKEVMDVDGFLDSICQFVGLGFPNEIED